MRTAGSMQTCICNFTGAWKLPLHWGRTLYLPHQQCMRWEFCFPPAAQTISELRGSALFHSGPRSQVLCQAIVTKLFCFWKTDLWKNGISAVLIYISHANSCYTFKNHLHFSVDLWFNIITVAHFSTDFHHFFTAL